MSSPDKVTYEMRECIGILTLHDPPSNGLALPEFVPTDLFNQWISDISLKGLIIRGEGKNFSSGGRLEAIFNTGEDPDRLANLMSDGIALLQSIQDLEIPVIAAINRVCFGGGLEIALACHIRVASENALLAFPEVNHNLMPGMGGTFRLPKYTGFSNSARMILDGDTITASEARELGLVDHIAPKDRAFEHAWTLMRKMTHDRPVKVIRAIMTTLKNSAELPQDEAMIEETRLFCSLAQDEAIRRKTGEA